jgi:hypothetical protein
MRVPTIVTNDVLFHEPRRRILQDVVTCIRHNVTIDELGDRRERYADRYLKSPEEMFRLFARYPDALARTVEIVKRCRFSLDELAYQYPEERADPSLTPQQTLENLTWNGAAWRYPEGLPDDVVQTLRHELDLIEKLAFAPASRQARLGQVFQHSRSGSRPDTLWTPCSRVTSEMGSSFSGTLRVFFCRGWNSMLGVGLPTSARRFVPPKMGIPMSSAQPDQRGDGNFASGRIPTARAGTAFSPNISVGRAAGQFAVTE